MIDGKTKETGNEMSYGHHLPKHFQDVLLVSFSNKIAYTGFNTAEYGREQKSYLRGDDGIVSVKSHHLQRYFEKKNEELVASIDDKILDLVNKNLTCVCQYARVFLT